MATPDMATYLPSGADRGELEPLSPYSALHYHFGMLLGEDDFKTDQGYHRAKMRIHNAWLHRPGVVWGFGVGLDEEFGEIRVGAGLALDAAGHELHLEADACVNVAKWFENHKNDPGFTITDDSGHKVFCAHVVISFKACLKQQVPAIMEPCNNAGTTTAYSRVYETVDVLLRPNLAPAPVCPYHRLRLMFGIDQPLLKKASTDSQSDDQAVLDEVARINALPVADQRLAWLNAFHRFAALDEIDLHPAIDEDERILLFPGQEYEAVVLANIADITLQLNNGGGKLMGGTVDTSVRPSHVATTTIQDLLCGSLLAVPETKTETETEGDTGPRIDPARVIFSNSKAIMFTVDKELLDASVKPAAFSVTWFDPAQGWQRSNVMNASYGGGETGTVSLDLDSAVRGRVRLIVFGTGATPLLGADLVPLAGAVGGSPGTSHDGHDFVYMKDFVGIADEPIDSEAPSVEGPSEEAPSVEASIEEPESSSKAMAALRRLAPKRKTSRK